MPFVETINIKMDHHEKLSYSIYDLSGRLLNKGIIDENKETIDLNHLIAGSYIFQVKDSEIRYSQLIIKL
jgi:hypothetical protein